MLVSAVRCFELLSLSVLWECEEEWNQAKQSPGSQMVIFSNALNEKLARESFIRQNLKRAMAQGHVQAYFQPQYSYSTGKLPAAWNINF